MWKKNVFHSFSVLLLILSIILGHFLHLYASWHQQLFTDEIHTLFFIKNTSLSRLLTQPIEPIHPNGIYVLLKGVYTIIPSVLALRLFLFLIFCASCWTLWVVLAELFSDKKIQLIGLSFWINSAYIWHFSFQLRMYGPALLLILLSIFTTLKKRPVLSLLCDYLLLACAYGGSIFVISKWISFSLIHISKTLHKKSSKKLQHQKNKTTTKLLLLNTGAIIPILFIGYTFIKNQHSINRNFLYWVKQAHWQDWALGFVSFLSGLFLPYFEGYAHLQGKWATLAISIQLVTILLMLSFFYYVLWDLFFGKQLLIFIKTWLIYGKLSSKFIVWVSLISSFIYSSLYLFSLMFESHLFHIRQLFPVAITTWLLCTWLIAQLNKKNHLLATLLTIGLILGNQMIIIKDSWKNNQTYPHRYSTVPGKPIVAHSGDIEFILRQCQTFDRNTLSQECLDQGIFIIEKQNLKNLLDESQKKLPIQWWTTNTVTTDTLEKYFRVEKKGEITCSSISSDYNKCQKL